METSKVVMFIANWIRQGIEFCLGPSEKLG